MGIMTVFLKSVLNLELMSGMDELFFQEDSRNALNIVAFQKYEKFEYDKLAYQMV